MLKLEPLKSKSLQEYQQESYLRDIVERNLEVAAQACIDIAARVISVDQMERPADSYGAILRLGEAGVLPLDFAEKMAPIAGFRNILVHEYVDINWNQVYENLQNIPDLHRFAHHIREWLNRKDTP